MKTIMDQLEEIKDEMCDKYCMYSNAAITEHDDDPDWLAEDEESPCAHCPLNRIGR